MNSDLRLISSVHGVAGQLCPIDVRTSAPLGSELKVTWFVVPRVTVAQAPSAAEAANTIKIRMEPPIVRGDQHTVVSRANG